jgi:hypothetical protein
MKSIFLPLAAFLLTLSTAFGQTSTGTKRTTPADSGAVADTVRITQPPKKIIKEIKLSSNPTRQELKKLFQEAKEDEFDLFDLLSVFNKNGSKVIPALTDGLFTSDEMRDTIRVSVDGKIVNTVSAPFNKAYFLLGLEAIKDTSIYRIVERAAADTAEDPEIKAMAITYLSNRYFNDTKVEGKIPDKSILNTFAENLGDTDSSVTYHRSIRDLAIDGVENWLGGNGEETSAVSVNSIKGISYAALKKLIAADYQKITWNSKTGSFAIGE